MPAHQLFHINGCRRSVVPGNNEDPKDSWDRVGVKTIAPEGAILSVDFDIFE